MFNRNLTERETEKCDYYYLTGLMYEMTYQSVAGNVNAGVKNVEKPPCCETTGSNTNAEHPKHSYDLDLLPP